MLVCHIKTSPLPGEAAMDWQFRLIEVYDKTCELWKQGLCFHAERMSNNKEQLITDEEIVAIFLNGIMTGKTNLKSIYNFTVQHLHGWFPQLGTYEVFTRRVNQLAGVFVALVEELSKIASPLVAGKIKIIDSLPIVMANAKRSSRAKVAPNMADKGYCGSKDMFYYGVKLHVVAAGRHESLPMPEYIGLTQASCHDNAAFQQIAPTLINCDLFADKAYANRDNNIQYQKSQNLNVLTPVKLTKGQARLDSADSLYSTAVSRIRQPIESLFNWLQEKTGIQRASKVRSASGLIVHVFGRMAAGLLLMLNF